MAQTPTRIEALQNGYKKVCDDAHMGEDLSKQRKRDFGASEFGGTYSLEIFPPFTEEGVDDSDASSRPMQPIGRSNIKPLRYTVSLSWKKRVSG